MARTKVIVKQEEEVVEREVLAKSIVEISRGINKLFESGLNERAVTCLLNDLTGVGKPDIRFVLRGLRDLENAFVTRK